MIDATVLNELAELDLNGEQLSAVIRIVAKIQAGYDERKAAHRSAQAKYRNKNRNGDITGISQGYHHPSSDKEKSPTPPKETNSIQVPPSPPKGGSSPAENEHEVLRVYSEMASKAGLAVPRSLTQSRRKQLASRIRENGLELVMEAIQRIGESSFCCGSNDRGWRADFDFLCQAKTFTALLEGKYADRRRERPPPAKNSMQTHQEAVLRAFTGATRFNDDDDFAGDTIDLKSADLRAH